MPANRIVCACGAAISRLWLASLVVASGMPWGRPLEGLALFLLGVASEPAIRCFLVLLKAVVNDEPKSTCKVVYSVNSQLSLATGLALACHVAIRARGDLIELAFMTRAMASILAMTDGVMACVVLVTTFAPELRSFYVQLGADRFTLQLPKGDAESAGAAVPAKATVAPLPPAPAPTTKPPPPSPPVSPPTVPAATAKTTSTARAKPPHASSSNGLERALFSKLLDGDVQPKPKATPSFGPRKLKVVS